MKNKHLLTLLVCAGLGLSAPLAHADSVPTTSVTAHQKIEAMKAKKEAALQHRTENQKEKLAEHTAKKEARIEHFQANKTAKIEQHAANKEASLQAHKDANAARKAILDKNRAAIKAQKTTTNP